jgi:hypothetical protein
MCICSEFAEAAPEFAHLSWIYPRNREAFPESLSLPDHSPGEFRRKSAAEIMNQRIVQYTSPKSQNFPATLCIREDQREPMNLRRAYQPSGSTLCALTHSMTSEARNGRPGIFRYESKGLLLPGERVIAVQSRSENGAVRSKRFAGAADLPGDRIIRPGVSSTKSISSDLIMQLL